MLSTVFFVLICAAVLLVTVGPYVYLVGWTVGSAVSTWVRSVSASLARIARGSGEGAMAAMESGLAVAEIGALAVLADGKVLEEERDTLARVLREAGVDVSVDEALARVSGRREDVSDPAVLGAAVARAAARLDAKRRAQALDIVRALAGGGSALAVAEGGYRGGGHADPERLAALFAAALGTREA